MYEQYENDVRCMKLIQHSVGPQYTQFSNALNLVYINSMFEVCMALEFIQ